MRPRVEAPALRRERTEVQREIDRLQEQGAARFADQIVALWDKKKALVHRIEALVDGRESIAADG